MRIDGKDLLIRELKQDIAKLEEENKQLKEERDLFQYSLEETRKSFSYRIGLIITSIPRKIRGDKKKNTEDR